MTGFGRATAEVDHISATVELKSVNNRYCEVPVRMPRIISDHELDIQNQVKKSFSRGRISVQVQIDNAQAEMQNLVVDKAAAKAYMKALKEVKKAARSSARIMMSDLMQFSNIFQRADNDEQAAISWKVTQAALGAAIEELSVMRGREGSALESDLKKRLRGLNRLIDNVKSYAPSRVTKAREKLTERLNELIDSERVNPERLEMEIALLADKLDVNEEVIRLESHVNLFSEALSSPEPVGRKLNFIAQEMNREINTIGSKANDADLSAIVVSMKEELEKIREQVENVE